MEIIEIMEIIYKEFIDVDIYSQMEIKMMKIILYIKEKNFILEIILDKIKKNIIIIIYKVKIIILIQNKVKF